MLRQKRSQACAGRIQSLSHSRLERFGAFDHDLPAPCKKMLGNFAETASSEPYDQAIIRFFQSATRA